jgi:hypothetical protein
MKNIFLVEDLGELHFAPPFPNTRTHMRVFGNEFLFSKFMTGVRKHLCAGDRNEYNTLGFYFCKEVRLND